MAKRNCEEVISRKWVLQIVREFEGADSLRFSELFEDLVRVSSKTLAERLRELEEEGIVDRECFREVPPRVEYSLTSKGRELADSLREFERWAKKWEKAAGKQLNKMKE